MTDPRVDNIVDHLWSWITTYKGREAIKDTTKLYSTKFDCYVNSSASDPLSFTVFELSDKGELMLENITRLVESEAAFFLFVNTKSGWIFAVKNTPENVKRLAKGEPIQNLKVRIVS